MNLDEAKQILLLYRPGTRDEEDPQIAEALTLAKSDAELSRWLTAHVANQQKLRKQFQQIAPPAGLMEQIVSEAAANRRMALNRSKLTRIFLASAVCLLILIPGILWMHHLRPADNTLAIFQDEMAGFALRGYAMDLQTNNAGQIQGYLQQKQAPADYRLPEPLTQASLVGCAVENWQAGKVSMICFRTGQPLPPGSQNDLWLFVVDEKSIADAPTGSGPQIGKVNRLTTATWTKDGKLYLLATTTSEEVLRSFL